MFIKTIFIFISLCTIQVYWAQSKIEIANFKDTSFYVFVANENLKTERWDTLAQPKFWKSIMELPADSCLVNVAATRHILGGYSFVEWQKKTKEQKVLFKDSVRKANNLVDTIPLYVTSGKGNFYQIEKVMPSISKAIDIFETENTDPWYAQAILLIESPGTLAYSNVGAYGPFQLMKSVAKNHGLKITKDVDERKDFDKSAKAAASLLRKTCVPEAKRILNSHNLKFTEHDLWFRLFVLHIYHAGAGNVQGLMNVIQPKEGGIKLITTMWQSTYGGFKNASQNYSQIALAALLKLDDLIYSKCDAIFDCSNL